jgi:RimJ/RimL family protein N-acetyltransferase
MLRFDLDRPIVAQRVILRALRPADFDDVHAYMSRDDVARWLLEDAYTLRDSEASHPRACELTRFERDGDVVLIAIEHAGRVVGHLDLTAASMEAGLVEVGWRTHPDAQGRGLATEAVTALFDVVFGPVGARRAIASLDPRNTASARLCERLGMRREAHHVQDMWFKGEWADTWVYAILASEWSDGRRERPASHSGEWL